MKKTSLLYLLLIFIFTNCKENESQSKHETRTAASSVDSLKQVKLDSIAIAEFLLECTYRQEHAKEIYRKTKSIRKQIVGKNLLDIQKKYNYGRPDTLENSVYKIRITYYPKVDITIVSERKDNTIVNACVRKRPELENDKTIELQSVIGKRMRFYDYVRVVSSVKYGGAEKIGIKNCINRNCVEYYNGADFTTVAFFEFNDKGDFVTLKKIAMGKVPGLDKY